MENQTYFTMKNKMKKLPLSYMKFLNFPHLNFINAYSLAPEIVLCFESRTAFLYNSKIENSEIDEFVICWQEGETVHNLKFMKTHLDSTHLFNPDTITSSVDIRKFSPLHEPPCFQFPVIEFFGAQETLQKHDLTMNTYVVRETDQIISSISISEDRFDFCVWELTEKQTARMGGTLIKPHLDIFHLEINFIGILSYMHI
ncbi:hypothetical protein CRE_31252 [Caenorhabditis remanei]|uniref:F-box associated domain-containing protein n=1 Tax=Caenorhabditis remanei TaxID=31234 RepID=E3MLU5_CAERE|nr:hypothetical protein CRE_31252 [Caenorhabditis remanei]